MQASPARFNRWILVIAGLLFLGLLAVLAYGKQFLRLPSFTPTSTLKPPASTVRLPESLRPQPSSSTPPPSPTPAPTSQGPDTAAPGGPGTAMTPSQGTTQGSPPAPPQPPVGLSLAGTQSTGTPATGQQQGRQEPTRRVATQPKPPSPDAKPPRKKGWLFPEQPRERQAQGPPFPLPKDEEDDEGGRGQGRAKRGASLLPQATWATPKDPTKVLYASQQLNAQLMHDVSSDLPGPIRLLLTQPVEDKFNQGHILLPQYSIILGNVEGQPKFGASVLGLQLTTIELPDGTIVALNKAQGGDRTGSTGVPGRINNHYIQLGIGAILTAALSVGSRSIGGSPQGFQPTIEQDFARDISQSVNQSGNDIIRRTLPTSPTITLKHGQAVTVQLSEPISFQTKPTIVTK